MKYTLDNISHFDFFKQLEKFRNGLQNIEIDNASELKTEITLQKRCIINFINHHIRPDTESIINFLDDTYYSILDENRFYYYLDDNVITDVGSDLRREQGRLNKFNSSLDLLIDYLSIIDSLFNSDVIVIADSVDDKKDFILGKLNRLFNDKYYSIESIFKLNDIKYRNNETIEIAQYLSRNSYIILSDGFSDKVKISVKGAAYIERKNKQKKKETELDKKIENIIEHLTKLGYGQEIIFEEIQELKVLQHKLSKKSWSQLLKGKLIDLALDKVLNVEIASSIYEYLTNNNFKLLK